MTPTDRERLGAILGMLGSSHAGERAAAGLQAEAFRRKHGLTWGELLKPVVLNIPARQPEPPTPEPPVWTPPPPPQPAWAPWTQPTLTPVVPKYRGPGADYGWLLLASLGCGAFFILLQVLLNHIS